MDIHQEATWLDQSFAFVLCDVSGDWRNVEVKAAFCKFKCKIFTFLNSLLCSYGKRDFKLNNKIREVIEMYLSYQDADLPIEEKKKCLDINYSVKLESYVVPLMDNL